MKFCFHSSFAHLILDPTETRVSGGAELQVALMARELVKRGHECVLISGDHGQPDHRVLAGVRTRLGGPFQTGALFDTVRALPATMRVLDEERPDFTFIYGWTAWLYFLGWARARGHTRLGFVCMLDTEVNGEYRRANPARGMLFEYGVRHAAVRYAISEYQVDCFARLGLDCTLYRPLIMPRTQPLPAVRNLDFLWVSRCQPIKRPHLYLDLVEKFPEARFAMICPAEDKALYASVAERAARLPNLEFRERVPYHEAQTWYDRAHVFVNTSTWEGFANSFIQAGQAETAILSLVVNTDGLLDKFEAGFHAVDDIGKFHEMAQTLLTDSAERRKRQLGAARFVAEWHDNEKNVKAFLHGLGECR